MSFIDIIILSIVFITLGLIVYFNYIRTHIKHESPCCRCQYAKNCSQKTCNDKLKTNR